ncbi:reverse transcriptase domain-containing protein [Tanacetum coccineum]
MPKTLQRFMTLRGDRMKAYKLSWIDSIRKFTHKGSSSGSTYLTFMHGHGHPELAKKLNDKIPKTIDEMFERVRAFIRGEVATGSAEMVRPSQGYKGYVRPTWSGGLDKARNKGSPRETWSQHQRCYQLKKKIEEAVASRKLAHLVKDICQNNQRSGSQGRNNVKVINMIREGGNHKRPFEEERSSLTDELTFPAIPWNQLMDEPIILEGVTKGNQKMQSSDGRFFRRNVSSSGNNKSSSNYGKVRKKQNSANEVCDNKMSFAIQHHNMKDRNEKTRSDRHLERVQGSWKEVQWHQQEGEKLLSLMGYTYKCFLRLPKEHNQIRMAEDDEEKTGFHTEEGEGRFLGYMVTKEGVRANPEKVQAIILSPTPKSPNQIRSLFLQLTAISKFIPKLAELKYPICEEGEVLMLCLRQRNETISSVMLVEREGIQIPVSYVSQPLQGMEICYTLMEKMIQALIHTTRSLRAIFRKHNVKVVTDGPMEEILKLSGREGRLAKWAAKAKSTPTPRAWRLYNGKETIKEGLGVGIILVSPGEKMHSYAIRLKFNTFDHAIDCEALLAGLAASVSNGIKTRPSVEETSSNKKGKAASNVPGAKPNYNWETSGSN